MKKVVIGDVHGCLEELKTLIAKLNLQETDEVVFVGDLLNKGPDSIGVWRYVQERNHFNGAKVVCCWGNHEDKHYRYTINPQNFTNAVNLQQIQEQFTDADHKFFEEFVLYHYDPRFNLLIVHAGLMQTIPDLNHFPYVKIVDYYNKISGKKRKNYLLNIRLRFLSKNTGQFVSYGKEKEGDPFWAELYDGRLGTVVFGHQAFGEPKFFEHAIGIDTGCVYGNKLSAIIFEMGVKEPLVISVNSREMYMKPDLPLQN